MTDVTFWVSLIREVGAIGALVWVLRWFMREESRMHAETVAAMASLATSIEEAVANHDRHAESMCDTLINEIRAKPQPAAQARARAPRPPTKR